MRRAGVTCQLMVVCRTTGGVAFDSNRTEWPRARSRERRSWGSRCSELRGVGIEHLSAQLAGAVLRKCCKSELRLGNGRYGASSRPRIVVDKRRQAIAQNRGAEWKGSAPATVSSRISPTRGTRGSRSGRPRRRLLREQVPQRIVCQKGWNPIRSSMPEAGGHPRGNRSVGRVSSRVCSAER